MHERAFYVTGTDTGIGKTVASTALLHALRTGGATAVGMKPVASGCVETAQGWRNDDALALLAASDPQPDYDDLNPYALPLPLAPELAARAAGVTVELAPIQAAYDRLRIQAQCVVVEGVGGWAAPLSGDLDQVDVVRALDLPVVLVVGLRLGCLNHAYLTARAIVADGCRLAGWIGNEIDPDAACRDAILDLLRGRIPAPCWGWLPHVRSPDAAAFSRRLLLPVQAPATTSGTDEG